MVMYLTNIKMNILYIKSIKEMFFNLKTYAKFFGKGGG